MKPVPMNAIEVNSGVAGRPCNYRRWSHGCTPTPNVVVEAAAIAPRLSGAFPKLLKAATVGLR